jgi:hypothetical protein
MRFGPCCDKSKAAAGAERARRWLMPRSEIRGPSDVVNHVDAVNQLIFTRGHSRCRRVIRVVKVGARMRADHVLGFTFI